MNKDKLVKFMKKIYLSLFLICILLFAGCDIDESEVDNASEVINIKAEELKITDVLYVQKSMEMNAIDIHTFFWKDMIMENVSDLLNKYKNGGESHYLEEDINIFNMSMAFNLPKMITNEELMSIAVIPLTQLGMTVERTSKGNINVIHNKSSYEISLRNDGTFFVDLNIPFIDRLLDRYISYYKKQVVSTGVIAYTIQEELRKI